MKNVVLIRHGQSLAQTARHQGMSRKDPTLYDCSLSPKGIHQAIQLAFNDILLTYNFELICTSPLTRAIATTCLWQMHHHDHHRHHHDNMQYDQSTLSASASAPAPASAPTIRIVVCAEISEAGSNIPENQGRRIHAIIKDLKKNLGISSECLHDWIDFSMIPESWPNVEGYQYRHGGMLDRFTMWLNSRRERNIAVVCHFNIIKLLLRNSSIDRVPNCEPIECVLTEDGKWMLKSDVCNKT
mmetsp:Transcript_4767/g.9107  ORF Transcript_4767/g.9107 Transcript_4767/m.9107 type:complete len:242 (-) Transcript_4767:47-772(-)|eukprot:CAMPEP_0176477450 /NCGR_PEP_ID=MMETSP0200_2-20121128/629_1 /TAXON_ID=947934 /ORGANISM="Chaetoceros sp., Strain GSL56" /LENGTH=241 /DNA_ID=CAMNT_0017873261 /DNA_START=84 /DNA_END=809 /DNA_ORIENTATION=+